MKRRRPIPSTFLNISKGVEPCYRCGNGATQINSHHTNDKISKHESVRVQCGKCGRSGPKVSRLFEYKMKVEDILSHKAGNVFDKAGNGLSPADAEAIRRWNEDQITISNALNFQRQRAAAVPKSILDTPLKDVVEAWKSMQAQRARLSQLEAMLQSQDAAAGKKTGGRI